MNDKFCGFLSLNYKFLISAMTKPFPGFIELSQQLQFSHHYTELFINMILKSSSKSYVYWDTLHTVGYYSKICYTVENLFLIKLVFPLYNITYILTRIIPRNLVRITDIQINRSSIDSNMNLVGIIDI